jgi:hypothetical protein
MPFFEDRPPFHITAEVRARLLRISPAAIDRLLRADKKKLVPKGISGGERDSGEFCLTPDAADVASGWGELRPLLNKAQTY